MRAVVAAVRAPSDATDEPATGGPYRQGLLTNLVHLKITLLFLTLLPQLVAEDEPRVRTSALLAGTFLLIAILWWWALGYVVGHGACLLRRRAARRALDAVTGVVLLGVEPRVAIVG